MPEEKNIEQIIKEIGDKSSQISDKTIRDEVLAKINKLRQDINLKNNPPKKSKPIKFEGIVTRAPSDLTTNYRYLSTKRLTSDVYSTDKEWPLLIYRAMSSYYKKKNYDSILNSGSNYYGGKAAEYITNSLRKKIKEKAIEIGANLVIFIAIKKRPFNYMIYRVPGLGKTNFQGQVSAKFYAKKG